MIALAITLSTTILRSINTYILGFLVMLIVCVRILGGDARVSPAGLPIEQVLGEYSLS